MSKWIDARRLVEILDGDEELVIRLVEHGVVRESSEGFGPDEVERVLICRTLVRELEVDVSALDIILRLREELLATRRDLVLLARELEKRRAAEPED